MGFLSRLTSPVAMAEAVRQVPVGYAAATETVARGIDPTMAAAFGIGDGSGRVTRDQAMQVPAVRRGRALIAGTIGTLPLVCYRTRPDATVEPVDRPLLRQLDPRTTPAWTLTWTVDDLMFYGVSWWRVVRRETVAGEAIGYPTAVERVAPERVTLPPLGATDRRVRVDGTPVEDADLVRFDGPDEGILAYGGPTIRLARALTGASQRVADNDVPFGALRPKDGAPELSPEEAQALLDKWEQARRDRSTAWLNGAVDYDTVAFNAQERQLTELAGYVDSQLARLLNLPASRIGAPQGSGMTYANVEADRRDLVDTTLGQYLTPIFQRLSLGDVTPTGQAVAVDLTAYLRGDTAQLVDAGTKALAAKAITLQEFRTRWLGLPPLPADQMPPTPTTGDTPA